MAGPAACRGGAFQGGMAMDVGNLALGIVVLALLVYRQLVTRPIRDGFRLPAIIAIIGVVELVAFFKADKHTHLQGTVLAALVGSLVLAAAFGAARAAVTKVWIEDGQALRRGGWVAAGLWVIALAAHLGYDELVYKHSNLGNATILLYLAVSLLVQQTILQARAQRLPQARDRFMHTPAGQR
jgi:hypothetical protein